MNYLVLHPDDLPRDGNTYEFEGIHHQDTHVSFIWVDMPPGGTIRLHRHPYEEVFIIQEGVSTFRLGLSRWKRAPGRSLLSLQRCRISS